MLNLAHNAFADFDILSNALRGCPLLRDAMFQGNPLPMDALARACATAWKDKLACGGGADPSWQAASSDCCQPAHAQ